MTIRPLLPSDTESLLTFANALILEDTFLMLSGSPMSLKEEEIYVASSLEKMKKNEKIHLIAQVGDAIVGSAEVRRGEKRKMHMGEIGLSVLCAYRGHGIGTKLMAKLIAEARRIGLKQLFLHCFENNTIARDFYIKTGFIHAGTVPGSYLYKGSYIGDMTFYLPLV